MSTDRAGPGSLERLSALVDGELDESAVTRACAHWRDDATARSSWHAYQVIGDVLRSDELAGGAHRNADFLGALRARLATEPVVLAPEPLPAPVWVEPAIERAAIGSMAPVRRRSWLAPSAVAAGFVVVAGVVMVMRGPGLGSVEVARADSAQSVIASPATRALAPVVAPKAAPVEQMTAPLNRTMIRDARLDRYLAAHKQFAGSSVLGWPSASLRNANVELPSR